MKKSFLIVAIMALISFGIAKADTVTCGDHPPIKESIGTVR